MFISGTPGVSPSGGIGTTWAPSMEKINRRRKKGDVEMPAFESGHAAKWPG